MKAAFLSALVVFGVSLNAGPLTAQAQNNWDPRRVYMTREALEGLLGRLEAASRSTVYTASLKRRGSFEAALIRTRLDQGDFQVGDRILLTVENEEALSDTFTVAQGQVLRLETVGELPLRGVLRSELEPYITKSLSQYLRDPVVTARSLIPVTIHGGVAQPGFYTVPSEALLPAAIMLAGGFAQDAKITEVEIERGDTKIWEAEPLQQAIVEGRTLDQLNLRGGDRIFVPQQSGGLGGAEGSVRVLAFLLGIPLTIVGLIAIF